MTNYLQTAKTKTKQKKVQGPKLKIGESAWTNDTIKPFIYDPFFF